MSREIKFRAWDKGRKVMEEIHDLYWFEEQGVRDSDGQGHHANYDLLEYTGKRDMNGKLECEGDIINVKGYWPKGELASERILLIERSDWGFNYKHVRRIKETFYITDDETEEIIGTIYENPELLEN